MQFHQSSSRFALLLGAAACWGVGTVLSKQVLADVPPLTLLPIQLLASCAFLAVVSKAGRTRITWSPSLRRLTALGTLNPGLAYALGLLGLTSISASMSVLLWAVEPVLIVALAVLLLREHVPGRLAVSMAVALIGVLLVVYRPGAAGSALGVALTLAAVTACALYTVLARRLLVDIASVTAVLVQQTAALVFAILLLGAAAATTGDGVGLASLTARTVLAGAATGVLYYGLAFWLYLAGLRQVSASTAGVFITLVPVFGVAAGYVVGERLASVQWFGAVVVVGAVTVLARGSTQLDGRPTEREPAPRLHR